MPRATTPSTPTDSLPEFLRSKAIGAVIAEALDDTAQREIPRTGAVVDMISDAAREIRDFHGLSGMRPAPYNDMDAIQAARDAGADS